MTSSRRAPLRLFLTMLVALGALGALDLVAPHRALAQAREPTAEELETARSLYKEGKALRVKGDLPAALEKLRAAHSLGNTPVTGIELARTYAQMNRIVEAREVSLSVGRIPVAPDETARSAQARVDAGKLAEGLESRIPALLVKLNGLAAGEAAHVVVDGVIVPEAAIAEPLKANPGSHEVTARAGAGPTLRQARGTAELTEGVTTEVVLTLPPPASAGGRPADTLPREVLPRFRGGGPSLVLVRAGFAVVLAGGTVGLLTGVTALNKTSRLGAECPGRLCSTTEGNNDLSAARTWALASTVSFAVTGVAVVAGVAGLVMRRDQQPEEGAVQRGFWIGMVGGGLGVHGRF